MASPEVTYPRVLSVDAATCSDATDMGILKKHLFEGWPRDRYAQLVLGSMPIEGSECQYNWRVTRQDVLRRSSGVEVEGQPGSRASAARPPHRIAPKVRRVIQPALNALNDVVVSSFSFDVDHALRNWAASFRPDVIFTFGASVAICKAAAQLAQTLDVPVLPYFTDDWPTHLYARPPSSLVLRGRLRYWLERVLARAPLGLTIGESMAREYRERFRGSFRACMDSVDLRRYAGLDPGRSGEEVTFSYIGVLAPDRWKPLRLVAEAVEGLRREGIGCRFHVYTMPADAKVFGSVLNLSEHVRIVGTLRYADVPLAQMRSDVLVHAEAKLSGLDAARTRLSVSTKVPQYLAAGRAVLAVGPDGVASIEYLRSSEAALVASSGSPAQIADAVRRLALDPGLRARLGRNGRAYCERHHTREAMHAVFRGALTESVERWRAGGAR